VAATRFFRLQKGVLAKNDGAKIYHTSDLSANRVVFSVNVYGLGTKKTEIMIKVAPQYLPKKTR
jgi:hypothetical protein